MDTFQEQIRTIQSPTPIVGFDELRVPIHLHIIRDILSGESMGVALNNIYTFSTCEDIARALWLQMGQDPAYHPNYVFFGIPNTPSESPTSELKYSSLTINWLQAISEEERELLVLENPLEIIRSGQIDGRFVTNDGQLRPVSASVRNRVTLYDAFKTNVIPRIHVFTLQQLLRVYGGVQPISERNWYGLFYPYFPKVNQNGPYTATEEEIQNITRSSEYFMTRNSQIKFINQILTTYPIPQLRTSGIRYLSFEWKVPQEEFEGCDILFYSSHVNPLRPFMRLLPPSGLPMTKLYQPNPLQPPMINDPLLLREWSQERSPTEMNDFFFSKVLVRPPSAGKLPVFGTLRVLEDGTGDFVLQPPKKVGYLHPVDDIVPLYNLVQGILEDLPFTIENTSFGKASLIVDVRFPQGSLGLTKAEMRSRVSQMGTFFQEIQPPSDESPLIMLRYKAVSNFVREDRLAAYLSHITDRRFLRGDTIGPEFVENVAKEFQIPRQEAQEAVAAWLRTRGAVSVADTRLKEFVPIHNSGTDIAIFAEQPLYRFNIFSIQSLLDFRIICTLLMILFSTPNTYWTQVPSITQLRTTLLGESATVPRMTLMPEDTETKEMDMDMDEDILQSNRTGPFLTVPPKGTTNEFINPDEEFVNPDEEEFVNPDEEEFVNPDEEEFVNPDEEFADPDADVTGRVATITQAASINPYVNVGNEDEYQDLDDEELERLLQEQDRTFTALPDMAPRQNTATEQLSTFIPKPFEGIESSSASASASAFPNTVREENNTANREESDSAVAFKFYINRLMRLDPTLFKYKLVNPKAKLYASSCGVNDDRQPLGLTQAEFDHNLEVYRNDPNIAFIVYRDNVKEEDLEREIQNAKGKQDIIHVLRYGSNPKKPNYYVCAQFFCVRDNLIIRPSVFRDGGNRCPFCGGTPIIKKRVPGPGQTVLEREPKVADNPKTLQSFIQFMKFSHHPEGLSLPCCFGLKKEIPPDDKGFLAAKAYARGKMGAFETAAEAPAHNVIIGEESGNTSRKNILPSSVKFKYAQIPYKIGQEYILGPEKYPLEPEKVGMCNKALDAYFGQESSQLVVRVRTKQEIKNSVEGFFRVGVYNRPDSIHDSLFAALAPILQRETIKGVADLFNERITPKEYLHLNFGNLLLEFFRPGDPGPENEMALVKWAQKYDIFTNVCENDYNMYELMRLYKSYHRFKNYLYDSTQRKQLRHFIQFLMEPGLIYPNTPGITPIVLEYKGVASMMDVQLDVKCPILGYDPIRHSKNAIAFLTHDAYGFWETLIFVQRKQIPNSTIVKQEGRYTIPQKEIENPTGMLQLVRRRYQEFIGQCRSSYRGIYTAQQGIDSRQILPISMVLRELSQTDYSPVGIVRDIYNHIVAITVGLDIDKPSEGREIVVPVVDDGSIDYTLRKLRTHLGFDCINLATAEQVYMMYTNIITPTLSKFKSPFYTIYGFEKTTDTNLFYSYILGSETSEKLRFKCLDNQELRSEFVDPGIQIPQGLIQSVPSNEVMPFDYDTNREVALTGQELSAGVDTQGLSVAVVERQQADEYYEHFRLLFTNWVESNEAGPSVRRLVNSIVERTDISDLVKRTRLEIMLRPTMERWIYPDDGPFENRTYLTRKDCLDIRDPGKCNGVCKWKVEEGGQGKCLLHTPTTVPVSSNRRVSVQDVFITRLLDELVRIPHYRRELLYQKVSKIKVPKTNIHIDGEWIIPENVPAWYELLRTEKVIKQFERPRFYEEFSRNPHEEENEDLLQPLPPYALPYFSPETRLGVNVFQIYPETNISPTRSSTITIAKLLEVSPAIIKAFGPRWNNDAFTQAELSMIAGKITPKKTLVQITPDGEITVASDSRDAKNSAIVFFPNYYGQVGVVYNKDTFSRILQPSVEFDPGLQDLIQRSEVGPTARNRTVQALTAIPRTTVPPTMPGPATMVPVSPLVANTTVPIPGPATMVPVSPLVANTTLPMPGPATMVPVSPLVANTTVPMPGPATMVPVPPIVANIVPPTAPPAVTRMTREEALARARARQQTLLTQPAPQPPAVTNVAPILPEQKTAKQKAMEHAQRLAVERKKQEAREKILQRQRERTMATATATATATTVPPMTSETATATAQPL